MTTPSGTGQPAARCPAAAARQDYDREHANDRLRPCPQVISGPSGRVTCLVKRNRVTNADWQALCDWRGGRLGALWG